MNTSKSLYDCRYLRLASEARPGWKTWIQCGHNHRSYESAKQCLADDQMAPTAGLPYEAHVCEMVGRDVYILAEWTNIINGEMTGSWVRNR